MLENLGNLGDFVGGIAVVVTLLYLASQIRQNTRSLRAAALDSAADQFGRTEMIIAQDPAFAELLQRGDASFRSLPDGDRRRYMGTVVVALRYIETHFIKHQQHLLPQSQWEGYRAQLIHSLGRPGWQACWEEVRPIFSREFREFVDAIAMDLRDRASDA